MSGVPALLLAALLAQAPAPEAVLEGRVVEAGSGLPVTDAVVFLDSLDAPRKPPPGTPSLAQREKAFHPPLVIVQAGQTVTFPNEDKIFHNVFSLSSGNQFDLGLYRQGESRTVRFTKPGVVDVFCNIHPQMVASILVLQNPHWVRTDAEGKFRLKLPAGQRTVVAWWGRGPSQRVEVQVPARGVVPLELTLKNDGRQIRHLNKHGQPYGRYR